MSWNGFNYNSSNTGYGSIHTTTTQTATLSGSLLTAPYVPGEAENQGKKQGGSRNSNKGKHTCTWEGCNKQYSCPHNVQQHIREAHTNERPYICEVCESEGVDKRFARPYGLNRHRQQVHNLAPLHTRQNNAAPTAARGQQNGGFQNGGFQNAAPAQGPGPYWNTPAAVNQYGEYAELGARLTEANAQMGAYGNMAFNSNTGRSNNGAASGAQSQNGFVCGVCGVPAASYDTMLQHMHTAHGVFYAQNCTCSICRMMFATVQQSRHGSRRNTAFSQQQQGPGAGMAPGFFPQQAGNTNGGADSNFGIDPALLSYSRSY